MPSKAVQRSRKRPQCFFYFRSTRWSEGFSGLFEYQAKVAMCDVSVSPITRKFAPVNGCLDEASHLRANARGHQWRNTSQGQVRFACRARRIGQATNMKKDILPEGTLKKAEERGSRRIQELYSFRRRPKQNNEVVPFPVKPHTLIDEPMDQISKLRSHRVKVFSLDFFWRTLLRHEILLRSSPIVTRQSSIYNLKSTTSA